MKQIELGNKVRDAVTGFVGIATARWEFLNGCRQFQITGQVAKDGEIRTVDVDAEQVKYVAQGVAKKKPASKATSAGTSAARGTRQGQGGPSRYGIVTRKATRT